MANPDNNTHYINQEDPRILLGEYPFTDTFFNLEETFISPNFNGFRAPAEHIKHELKDLKNMLAVGHINARSVPKHISEISNFFMNLALILLEFLRHL